MELVVIEGRDIGKSFSLVEGRFTIGRSKSDQISLTDRRIAPKQVQIFCRGNRLFFENLLPQAEIYLNGERVQDGELHHGDMLTIGDTTFLVNQEDFSSQIVSNPLLEEVSLSEDDASTTMIHLNALDMDSVIQELPGSHHERQKLKTLYRLSHILGAYKNVDKLLNTLLELLFQEIPFIDRGVIFLFNEEHGRFLPKASRSKNLLNKADIKVSKTILKKSFENKESILSEDALHDQRFEEGMSIAEHNIRSVMCSPLIWEDTVQGFIYLDTTSSGQKFGEDHLNFLTAVSQQASLALSHAFYLEKSNKTVEKLRSMGEASQDLSNHLEKAPILKSLGKYIFKIMNCQRCLVALYEEDCLCYTSYVLKSKNAKWNENQLPLIRDLCKQVISNNKPLLISDITVDPSIYFEPLKERIDSFVIVPIPYKSEDIEKANQAIGAICISEKISGGVFTHEDQDLLSILANQVGIALANAELYEQATVDSLTKVFVRRYFFQKLEKEIKRSRFYQSPLVLLMMDIDHFKKKNDTYGHQAGDYILQEVGRLLKENLRSGHVVARYGGEEFAVILCNTPKDVGRKIGERLRKSIESYSFVFEDQKIPTTISIGGALLEEDDDLERFIHKADTALYKAKETGRNKVVFA